MRGKGGEGKEREKGIMGWGYSYLRALREEMWFARSLRATQNLKPGYFPHFFRELFVESLTAG